MTPPHQRRIPVLVSKLLEWFSKNPRDLPWRRTLDPYAIWVSEIMLQQTQVKTVIPYWERWMRALPDVRSLARARPERVLKLWEGLGYYTRARNMQKAAQQILERHGGRFPQDFEAVLALPGVGRYTAGAITSIAFNQPRPIVDGNVVRVLSRLFGIDEDPREKRTNDQLWELAGQLVATAARLDFAFQEPHPLTPSLSPSDGERVAAGRVRDITNDSRTASRSQWHRELSTKHPLTPSLSPDGGEGGRRPGEGQHERFPAHIRAQKQAEAVPVSHSALKISGPCSALNQSLMELGATICTPRQPLCETCPVRRHCVAHRQGRVEELPVTGPRVVSTARRFVAFAIEHQGQFLVCQRPAGVVNARLWEFPNVEVNGQAEDAAELAQATLGSPVQGLQPLGTIKHTITRYRITVEAFRGRLDLPHAEAHRRREPFVISPTGGKGARLMENFQLQNRTRIGTMNLPSRSSQRKSALVSGPKRMSGPTSAATRFIERPSEDIGTLRWLPLAQLDQLAFTSAHRRLLKLLTCGAPATARRRKRG